MATFFTDGSGKDASGGHVRVVTSDDRLKSVAARFEDAPDEDEIEVDDAPLMEPIVDSTSQQMTSSRSLSVGEQLIRGMSRDAKKTNPEALKTIFATTTARCVPTVVGGFLGAGGTTHAATDVRIGLILSRMTPTAPAPVVTPSGVSKAGVSFKREEDITDEESTLGAVVTEATVNDIFQVTRVDGSKDACEVAFADGDRAVVLRANMRAATTQEIALFRKWLQAPTTLPSDALRRKRLRNDGQPEGRQRLLELRQRLDSHYGAIGEGDGGRAGGVASGSVGRWLQKRLVVRYVSEDRPHLTGCKFVVANVNHKDDRVLLQPFVDAKAATSQADRGASLVEVATQKDLETVLPKTGCPGIVLHGPHRGEMAVLVRREKDTVSGETTNIVVKPVHAQATVDGTTEGARDGGDLTFTVDADAFCLMGQL